LAEVKRVYEGMFLADAATADWDRITADIQTIMDRSEAEVISLHKWDDRRLAYEIGKCRRGLYVLVYFRMAPSKVSAMERDVQLSDTLIRTLILSAEGVSEEQMGAETPAMIAERQEKESAARRAERTAAAVAVETEEDKDETDMGEDDMSDVDDDDNSSSFTE
jgi:small subunit ribosomal protein S6